MIVIDTRAALVDWLDSQCWLEEAFVDELVPLPDVAGGSPPDRARITLRMRILGGLTAGEQRRMRRVTIEASGVAVWDLPSGGFAAGNCCQGAELIDEALPPIAFTLDVPWELNVQCSRIEVTECEWDEVVPEWFSETEFSAEVRSATLPTPQEWCEALAARGYRVAWRYSHGPAMGPEQVTADYVGWFLQHADRVADTTGGLFFFAARPAGGGFALQVQDKAEDGGTLLRALGAHIGSYPDVEVHCGNVVLDASAWNAHIGRLRRAPNSD